MISKSDEDINIKIEQILRETPEIQIPKAKLIEQFKAFDKGFPSIELNRPCTIGDGIHIISPEDHQNLLEAFNYCLTSGRVMKFVPASGAATRMFKSILTVINTYDDTIDKNTLQARAKQGDVDCQNVLTFIDSIDKFAFFNDLKRGLKKQNLNIAHLLEMGQYRPILQYTVSQDGLNYADLPKGLIKFHHYPREDRTPLEEHLIEAIEYARSGNQVVSIHFTVSQEFVYPVKNFLYSIIHKYKKEGIKFEIGLSAQKKSTDTIAFDLDNSPFENSKGDFVFRPGGHGALIENLNDLRGDIIFIKNIDNVVPDYQKKDTYLYKKLLGGYLTQLQNQVFYYLRELEKAVNDELLEEILTFAQEKLSIYISSKLKSANKLDKVNFLRKKLNRPLRICGMVKNEGEPGGGPFWVQHADGSTSLQIVEKSQIDMNSVAQRKILESSTHFNPVDLVCGVCDYTGKPFDLSQFVDTNTGFISQKSVEGKPLKALELPGLWNGAMAFWNTIFVQVPLSTFSPVKTVNDLLKPNHQPQS